MNAIVIEHVPVDDLPPEWRAKLAASTPSHVTVRIEEESAPAASPTEEFVTNDPAFGIWRDRHDIPDVGAFVRTLRAPRYNRDGSRDTRSP